MIIWYRQLAMRNIKKFKLLLCTTKEAFHGAFKKWRYTIKMTNSQTKLPARRLKRTSQPNQDQIFIPNVFKLTIKINIFYVIDPSCTHLWLLWMNKHQCATGFIHIRILKGEHNVLIYVLWKGHLPGIAITKDHN